MNTCESRRWLTIAVTLVLTAGMASAELPYREDFDQTYPIAATGVIALENINGNVRVEVWERGEVRIQAVKTADSRELLEALEIRVDAGSNSVRVETEYPSSRGFFGHSHGSSNVEFTLTVPRTAELDSFELVNGDLEVVGVAGGVRAETVNGRITTNQVSGSLQLTTVNGRLEVTCDRVGNGDRLELESVNGTIELILPPTADATVRAETVNGRLRNDFGFNVRKHKYVGADLSGTLGSGAADVELSTVNGSITIRGK